MKTFTGCKALVLFTLAPLMASASIPIAHCRPTDRPESGLSGTITQQEVDRGDDVKGQNCNVDLVGQYQGEGASWQLTAWKNCAYFDQRRNAAVATQGTVVVDVTDPAHPQKTTIMTALGMLDPWESLKINPARQLLGAVEQGRTGFAIYDVSADCKAPVKVFDSPLTGNIGHTGQWAPDGKTYYVTPLRSSPSVIPIDTSDVANSHIIPCGAGTLGCNSSGFYTIPQPPSGAVSSTVHDLEFSPDGNIAYLSTTGSNTATSLPNGLVLLDVSDFQSRKPNPEFRVISSLGWFDGSRGAQNALPVKIRGKQYILFSDEAGAQANGCAAGMSANGFPRLIDISDPKNPKTVAKIILDVHDPANCTAVTNLSAATSPLRPTPGGPSFGSSCHYCQVDDADDGKIAGCSCFSAGARFFDISNPDYVKEIAYFKPPAQGTKVLQASQYATQGNQTDPASPNYGFVRHYDWSTSKFSWPKDRGMTSGDVWITGQDNGFMVVKLAVGAGGGGGCASVDASLGALVALGVLQLARRRRARS